MLVVKCIFRLRGFVNRGKENIPFSSNHHKEYLVVAVQLGLVGLAVLLYLFFTQWRLARKLSAEFEQATAQGLVLMILSARIVSSALIDHSKGFLYLDKRTAVCGLKYLT